MRFSYSRVGCYEKCPYQFKLRYIDGLKTIPDTEANNALYLGLGLHKGIEDGSAESGVAEYQSHYNVLTDDIINWSIQLEYQIPRVLDILPQGGEHEVEIQTEDWIGFIDYLHGDTIYDFKFTNNIDNYLKSPQLSIYKSKLESIRDIKINHLKFVFIPKIQIRQKKTETIQQFRNRLLDELESSEIRVIEVDFNNESVTQFQKQCQEIESATEFPKNETKLCGWCEFQLYCQQGENWMIYNNENEK